MKIIKNITENEMISVFLKAKIDSFRFKKEIKTSIEKLKINIDIIKKPNFENKEENKLRKKLFLSFGSTGKGDGLFEDFPENISWKKVIISKNELKKVKYIDYDYWNELSNGTRLINEGARNIRKGKEVFNQSNNNFLKALEYYKKGGNFPDTILITKNSNSDLIVVDGHLRLTVYLLDDKYIPNKLEAIIGFSEEFGNLGIY